MNKKQVDVDNFVEKVEPYLIIVIIASFVGVLCGVLGALFIKTIDIFIEIRGYWEYIVFFIPLVGVITVFLNKEYKLEKKNTELISDAVKKEKDIPSYLIPTLFTETTLSHFVGASVGRMEAPIKMGGALGNYIAKFFNLIKKDRSTVIASGVAALFGSVFGAPLTGTILAYELCITKENKKPIFFIPILLAAAFSRFICFAFGVNSFIERLIFVHHASFEWKQIILIVVLMALCLIFALLFNKILETTKNIFAKIKNEYIRIVIGSIIMIIAIYLLDTTVFCGNDTKLIELSLLNNKMWYIFIVKTLLTAVCLGVGFRGGDIGPAFIAGVTFGILISSLMGLDHMMGAAIGAVSSFGGVTGCIISSIALGVEIFGIKSIGFFIIIAIGLKYLIDKQYIEKKF